MKIKTDNGGNGGAMVELTSLIDVVFLLLIFFMVTMSFQEDERDLAVSLPDAENGNQLEELPETMFVSVRKDGSLHVGDKTLDRDELKRVLARAKRKNEKQRVVVRADQTVEMRHPVAVLDMCSGLGITTSIATAAPTAD